MLPMDYYVLFPVASCANPTMLPMDPYLAGLTGGGNLNDGTGQHDPLQRNPLHCYTPPDSVNSAATPSPVGTQADMVPSGHTRSDNFDCTQLIFSNPGPSTSTSHHLPLGPSTGHLGASVPFGSRVEESVDTRLASRRPQAVSSKCSQASIEILNPREEYDKIQRKHGPKGKFSEQRIANGQVRFEYPDKFIVFFKRKYVLQIFTTLKCFLIVLHKAVSKFQLL